MHVTYSPVVHLQMLMNADCNISVFGVRESEHELRVDGEISVVVQS